MRKTIQTQGERWTAPLPLTIWFYGLALAPLALS